MKVKVCGMVDPDNLNLASSLDIDFVGYNFYPASKRYVDTTSKISQVLLEERIKKVGVFVNASSATIEATQVKFDLDYIQLHGDESVAFTESVAKNTAVIKVFRISENFDFQVTTGYQSAQYFLFDTYTKDYGGSGKRFDWRLLDEYTGDTPFFLAGGISPDDLPALRKISHPKFIGIDINSGFELSPGIKNIATINKFISELKSDI